MMCFIKIANESLSAGVDVCRVCGDGSRDPKRTCPHVRKLGDRFIDKEDHEAQDKRQSTSLDQRRIPQATGCLAQPDSKKGILVIYRDV